jgi:hypothetical protein
VPPVDSQYLTKLVETDGTTWFAFIITIVRFVASLTLWIFIIIVVARFVAALNLWIHICSPRFTTALWSKAEKQVVSFPAKLIVALTYRCPVPAVLET